ncbi:MAG: hypothetical protein ACRBEQ_12515 [Hyphomonas sp.]
MLRKAFIALALTAALTATACGASNAQSKGDLVKDGWPRTEDPQEYSTAKQVAQLIPDALAPPPLPVPFGNDGSKSLILYWDDTDSYDSDFITQASATEPGNRLSPHVFTMSLPKAKYSTPDKALKAALEIVGASSSGLLRPEKLEAADEVYGLKIFATYGTTKIKGKPMTLFADVTFSDKPNISVALLYAPPKVFDSWGGIAAPLYANTTITYDAFPNPELLAAGRKGSDADKMRAYEDAINNYISNGLSAMAAMMGSMSTSTGMEGVMKDSQGAADCAMSSNCEWSYGGTPGTGEAIYD